MLLLLKQEQPWCSLTSATFKYKLWLEVACLLAGEGCYFSEVSLVCDLSSVNWNIRSCNLLLLLVQIPD